MEALLQFKHVDAGYGRVKILSDLNFEVYPGEVFGVIGPNGCGKTTMFNALLGHIIPTKGEIIFNGVDITKRSPNERCRMGIGRTYQIPRPFVSMTVFENVLVFRRIWRKAFGTRRQTHRIKRVAFDRLI